jgi:conjugal transfer pilus assembly protein TraE
MMFRTPVSGSGLNKSTGNNIWNMVPDKVPRVLSPWGLSVWGRFSLSLATNIIQGINNYRLQTEQKVVVTPMLFSAPFAVSQNQADASYLEAAGQLYCVSNVTPETVDAQHAQLLRYVFPGAQNSLKIQLAEMLSG